jgi:hypothetical protein
MEVAIRYSLALAYEKLGNEAEKDYHTSQGKLLEHKLKFRVTDAISSLDSMRERLMGVSLQETVAVQIERVSPIVPRLRKEWFSLWRRKSEVGGFLVDLSSS